jgi:hypothetical protein
MTLWGPRRRLNALYEADQDVEDSPRVAELKQQVAELEEPMAELLTKTEQQIDDLRLMTEMAELSEENRKLKATLGKSEQTVASLESELSKSKQTVASLESELSKSRLTVVSLAESSREAVENLRKAEQSSQEFHDRVTSSIKEAVLFLELKELTDDEMERKRQNGEDKLAMLLRNLSDAVFYGKQEISELFKNEIQSFFWRFGRNLLDSWPSTLGPGFQAEYELFLNKQFDSLYDCIKSLVADEREAATLANANLRRVTHCFDNLIEYLKRAFLGYKRGLEDRDVIIGALNDRVKELEAFKRKIQEFASA